MKNKVLNLLKENLLEILPELEGEEISPEASFEDLGANSMDRAELIMLTLERLDSEISRIEFVGARNMHELADLLLAKHEGALPERF